MTIGPNQSFLDIILMQYGTVEAAMKVAAANNMSITGETAISDNIAAPMIGDNDVSVTNYLKHAGITIGTKGA